MSAYMLVINLRDARGMANWSGGDPVEASVPIVRHWARTVTVNQLH